MGEVIKFVRESKELSSVAAEDNRLSGLKAFHSALCPQCGKKCFNVMTGWRGPVCVAQAKCDECNFSFNYEEPAPKDARCFETAWIQQNFEMVVRRKIAEYQRITHNKKFEIENKPIVEIEDE